MLFYEQLGVDVAYDLGQGSVVVIFFGVLYKSKLGPLLLVPWSDTVTATLMLFFSDSPIRHSHFRIVLYHIA